MLANGSKLSRFESITCYCVRVREEGRGVIKAGC